MNKYIYIYNYLENSKSVCNLILSHLHVVKRNEETYGIRVTCEIFNMYIRMSSKLYRHCVIIIIFILYLLKVLRLYLNEFVRLCMR